MEIQKYFSSYNKLAKPTRIISKRHISFIKSLPCIISRKPNPDAHHVQTKGVLQNDFLTVPLSHELHMELHQIGKESFEKKYCIDLEEAIISKLIERIIELEKEQKKNVR